MKNDKIIEQEEKVRRDFLEIREDLDKWGKTVDEILNSFVKSHFSSDEHVQKLAEHRIKKLDSYCEKVLIRKSYSNPILDVTDKVGTRLVLLDRDDVQEVITFIESCEGWQIHERARDTNKSILKEPELFTYQSDHFIVKPKQEYETKISRDILTCEIQVRTILQHAYAEVCHDTFYKKSVVSNNKAKRMLASSMAFLEAADEKFLQVYEVMKDETHIFESIHRKIFNLYKGLFPEYDEQFFRVETSLLLLNIYSNNQLHKINDEIENYVNSPENYIGKYVLENVNNCFLFQNPIIFIAFYGIMKFPTVTHEHWPYSFDIFEYVVETLGISMDSFR